MNNNTLTEFILSKGEFSYKEIVEKEKADKEADHSEVTLLLLGIDYNSPPAPKPQNALDAFFQTHPEIDGIGNGRPLRYTDKKERFNQMDESAKEIRFWFGDKELIIYSSYPRFSEIVAMLRA